MPHEDIRYIGIRPPDSCPYANKPKTERIIAGEEMDHHKRLIWPVERDPYPWVTGIKGFLDFQVLQEDILGFPYMCLGMLGIEPDYQNDGYAQDLIRAAENIAVGRGIAVVTTSGMKSDNDKMLHIIEKLGYQECLDGGLYSMPWRDRKIASDPIFDVFFIKGIVAVSDTELTLAKLGSR